MDWFPDAPAAVLIAVTIAAALLLIEVALPTLGVAGTASLVLAIWAVATLDHHGYVWWPLLLVVCAVAVWAVLLTRRRASPAAQTSAALLFAAGTVGYGIFASDPATIVLGAVGAIALPFGFRPLLSATSRLMDMPSQTGMEALVGRVGPVVAWEDGRGTVRIDGSLWNARGPASLSVDAEVVVRGFSRMTIEVVLPASIT